MEKTMFKTNDDFYQFRNICCDIRLLSNDERREKMNALTVDNINEPYSVALVAIGVMLPNRLADGMLEILNSIEDGLPRA